MSPEKAREYSLRRLYGITPEQYQDLFDKQGGKCGVCGKSPEENGKALAVDHNHKTGEIRGLLCGYCNHRLVGRHTDADLIRAMAEYLERTTGLFVPPRKRRKKRVRKSKPKSK